jgi:hypothetical protein
VLSPGVETKGWRQYGSDWIGKCRSVLRFLMIRSLPLPVLTQQCYHGHAAMKRRVNEESS